VSGSVVGASPSGSIREYDGGGEAKSIIAEELAEAEAAAAAAAATGIRRNHNNSNNERDAAAEAAAVVAVVDGTIGTISATSGVPATAIDNNATAATAATATVPEPSPASETQATAGLRVVNGGPSAAAAAAAAVDGDGGDDGIRIPSYRQLLVFLSTTTLIWLSEPLLSLVDTTVVGWTAKNSVVQLAALGPATTLYDSLLYLCYFLSIATTNKLAPALAERDYEGLQRTTSHVMGVSVVLGMITTAVVFGWGKALLRGMIGNASSSSSAAAAELLHYATRYTWIRASVGIASIVGMTMQSFCLATLDTKTPARAMALASVTNLIGDVGLRRWGVQGAAVATSVSSLLSTAVLFGAVRKQMKEWRRLELRQRRHGKIGAEGKGPSSSHQADLLLASNTTDTFEPSSTNGAVPVASVKNIDAPTADHIPVIPFFSLPDRASLIDLCLLSGPIFFVIMAKVACYGAMTLRCTDFGVVALAAHNIMMRVFFFYGTFGDSLSQTAQSFLPATMYPKPSQKAFREVFKRLLAVTGLVAVVNSNMSMLILKRMGRFLANDSTIVRLMAEHSGFLGISVLVHPLIILLEGVVIASRDFKTLVTTYVVTLGLHFGILKYFSGSFAAVWRTFFLFQSIRLGNFGFQVWRKQMAIRREEASKASRRVPGNVVFVDS